jgi:hypothetical protein
MKNVTLELDALGLKHRGEEIATCTKKLKLSLRFLRMIRSSDCHPNAELELPQPARMPSVELERKGSSAASPVQVHQDSMVVVARCTCLADVTVE